jgi:hypothetical protein
VSEVTVDLLGDGDIQYSSDFVRVQVGVMLLSVVNLPRCGRQVDLHQIGHRESGLKVIPSKRWKTLGFFKKGRCARIDREEPVTEVLSLVRDLAARLGLKDQPTADAWVATGNDKMFVSDAKCSWSLIHNADGGELWGSSVGGRARWPDSVVPLTAWGRPVVPATWVMDLVRQNVGRLVDPLAWKDKTVIRLGGRET